MSSDIPFILAYFPYVYLAWINWFPWTLYAAPQLPHRSDAIINLSSVAGSTTRSSIDVTSAIVQLGNSDVSRFELCAQLSLLQILGSTEVSYNTLETCFGSISIPFRTPLPV